MAVRRNYRINLRNYGNPPAIMVSQYDENYDLVFEVYDGVVPATGLNTYTVKLVGRQPGDDPALKYEFTGTVSGIANNILSFTIDTTMTGRAGKGTAEIVILDTTNDVKFASFNLPVYVEKAAVPDDAIDADVERAQEIADEVQDIVDTAAAEVKGEAEAWAVGQRDGVDVPSTDPAYENNAKYYAEQAQDIADSIGIDATLSISGKAADAKKTGDEIEALKEDLNDVVPYPESPDSKYGTAGQLLRTKGNGKTEWVDEGLPTDEQTAEAVTAWLNDHPEATTTVEDGSLTYEKLVIGTLGFVTPEMFGAKGDGVTDDTLAIQTAINTGYPVYFMPKTYLVVASILDSFNSHVALNLISGSVLVGNGATIKLSPNSYNKYRIIKINEADNVFIDGLNIVGDKDQHTGTTGEQGYGISIIGSTNIHVDNCITQNCWGDGIDISATYTSSQETSKMSKGIYINNHESYNNRRQGMSVEGCDGLYVDNMYVHDIGGINPQAGIDFEPSIHSGGNKFEYIDNVFISNFRCENTVGHSIYIEDRYSAKVGKYAFNNCVMESCRIVSSVSDGNNGSNVQLNNVTLNQKDDKYAFYFHIVEENTKITGNHITVYRNGTNGFATFETANSGIINFNDVSLIGGDSTMKLFNISSWVADALANVILNNLFAPNGCRYVDVNNENIAQSMGTISLAKDIVIKNKSDNSYLSTIANVYAFDSQMAANRNLYLPWMYDGYELTIINESDYAITLSKETSVKPSIYFDDITTNKTITVNKGIVKLKFNTSLGAWVLQDYIGDVTAA